MNLQEINAALEDTDSRTDLYVQLKHARQFLLAGQQVPEGLATYIEHCLRKRRRWQPGQSPTEERQPAPTAAAPTTSRRRRRRSRASEEE